MEREPVASTITPRKYALVGTGARAQLYVDALLSNVKRLQYHRLCAICDTSLVRMQYHIRRCKAWMDTHGDTRSHDVNANANMNAKTLPGLCIGKTDSFVPKTYLADDFTTLLQTEKPDCVIICTPDRLHAHYIELSLEYNVDVITEKPVTRTRDEALRVRKAERQSKGRVQVAFNYRYMNIARAIKQELEEGAIGDPLWVQMTWMLDRRHGADYFRRWHAKEEEGGSLLVHKSSHHFDLLRWWLNDNPENVTAMGSLSFYGKENAKKRKEYDRTLYSRYTPIGRYFESHPKTSNDETEKDCSSSSKNMSSSMSCSSCSCSPSSPLNKKADNDPFSLNLLTADRSLQRLYLDAEEESGYLRDQNVFGDHITIQDNMNVITETSQKQIHVSYSLITFAAEEGFHLRIVGTHGQLEAQKKRPDGMETSITGENGDEKHNRCQYNNSTIDKTTSQNDREVAEHDNEANENKNQTYSMICEDGGVHFGSSSSDRSSPTATSSRTPIQRTNVYAHNAHNDGNLLPKDDEYVRVWTTQSTVGEEGKVGQATRTKSFEDDKIGSYAQHSQTAQYAPASLVRRDHVTHQPEKGHKEADTKFINELFDIPEPHSEHEDSFLSYPHSHSSSIASLEDGIWAVSWGHSALHSLKTSGRTVRIPQADSPALFSSSSNSSWNRKSLFTQKRR